MLSRRTTCTFTPSLALLACLSHAAAETRLDVSVTRQGLSSITVAPCLAVEYAIVGELAGDAVSGLSMFAVDLTFDGGTLQPAFAPAAPPMTHFDRPAGLTNPAGFGGTVIDGVLHQIGGAQNTLGLTGPPPLPAGTVATGVALTPTVLARGVLAAPQAGGTYALSVSNILARAIAPGADGGGGVWQTTGVVAGTAVPLIIVVDALASACGDADDNGIRDDTCAWASCADGACALTPVAFGDVGGPFGACPADGFANVHDRTHILKCFEGSSACALINLDLSGAFGTCAPDGACNVHDVNHTLMAFAAIGTCECGAAPTSPAAPQVVGGATLQLVPRDLPPHRILIDVFIDGHVPSLQSLEVHLEASADLTPVAATIESERRDFVFADQEVFSAVNVAGARLLAGVDHTGVPIDGRAYVATFAYDRDRPGPGRRPTIAVATGTVVVDSFIRRVPLALPQPTVVREPRTRHE